MVPNSAAKEIQVNATFDQIDAVLETMVPSGTSVNAQTAGYTAVLGDGGNIITMDNASANNFTVPPNSAVAFAVGATLTVVQKGAGQTTLVPGSGVTINTPSSLTTRAQWSTVALIKLATDTWVATGDLT